jgi:hypothetical protein
MTGIAGVKVSASDEECWVSMATGDGDKAGQLGLPLRRCQLLIVHDVCGFWRWTRCGCELLSCSRDEWMEFGRESQ